MASRAVVVGGTLRACKLHRSFTSACNVHSSKASSFMGGFKLPLINFHLPRPRSLQVQAVVAAPPPPLKSAPQVQSDEWEWDRPETLEDSRSTPSTAFVPETSGVNRDLPSYAESVLPGATLGAPSRTIWTPVKLPRSSAEVFEALSSGGLWETFSSPKQAVPTLYSVARTAYFIVQGLSVANSAGVTVGPIQPQKNAGSSMKAFWDLYNKGAYKLLGSFLELFRMDSENIRRGIYRAPYDMDPRHRQWRPTLWRENHERLREFTAEFKERQARQGRKEVLQTAQAPHLSQYPDYYLQNFHYQSDGWLSDSSAQVYEYSTETLFSGTQDAMQRQTLVPLHYYMKHKNEGETRMMDIACGTGRFVTFLKDNYPRAKVTGMDLSPYYLKAAKENMDYFYEFDRQRSGYRGLSKAEFIQGNAEKLPVADGSLDVISCVYLFHELPPKARENVVQDAARALKPGGIFVWTDSLQKGDRPESDAGLKYFPKNYHEPYYMSFINTDFKQMFADVGMRHESTVLAHATKVMCFRKI